MKHERKISSTSEGATAAHKLQRLVGDLIKFQLDIEAALVYARGSHTFDDVVGMVMSGRVHFYTTENSFLIAEIQTLPQYRIYHMFLAGGKLKELVTLQSSMMDNARKFKCRYGTMNGRQQWKPTLEKLGWKQSHINMCIEVT